MPKFNVYGIVTATKYLGNFEAATEEEAIEKALASDANYVSICHQCAGKLDLDDICCNDATAELVES